MRQILCTLPVTCSDDVSTLQVVELVGKLVDIGLNEYDNRLHDDEESTEARAEARLVDSLDIGELDAREGDPAQLREKFAALAWSVGDVRSLGKFDSDAAAEEWLARNQRRLRDRLCEVGHGVIADLLSFDGIPAVEPGDDDDEEE